MGGGDFAGWLSTFLSGRALLWEELIRAIRDQGWELPETVVWEHVQQLQQTGAVEILPGVVKQAGTKDDYRCNRCGEEERFFVRLCQSCGQWCATCEACLPMGRCRSCAKVIIGRGIPELMVPWPNMERLAKTVWDGTLTQFQRQAAETAVKLVRDELPQKELLIHAVTGAGKTEMTFPAVAEALRRGMRVGFVTPRREVVLELFPRLGQAFAGVPIVALYGGSPERWAMAPVMVLTTHQSLRFHRLFDLLVVDEVDAFPFHHDPLLPRAVARALAHGGRVLYLTATPPEHLLERVRQGVVAKVAIPQRHHGHPLPVPRWVRVSRLRQRVQQGMTLPTVEQLVQIVEQDEGQLLVFVPRVADVEIVVRWWQKQFQGMASQVDGIFSEDPARDEKVAAFRNGKLKVLVTTTLMERGVTISRCHVLVLFADAPIFDAAALVQIAGRVGRDAAYPNGEVWFCSETQTQDMHRACQEIFEMNRLAGQVASVALDGRRKTRPVRVWKDWVPEHPVSWRRWRSMLDAPCRWIHGAAVPCVFCRKPTSQVVDWQQGVLTRWVPVSSEVALCSRCLKSVVWLTGDTPLCQRCGRLMHSRDVAMCRDCQRWVKMGAELFRNRSVAVYSGSLRRQWHAYKYGGNRSLDKLWIELLTYGWRCHQEELGIPDEMVYVPMHPDALRERGFNQAQVLAAGLSERLGIPVVERLARVGANMRQSQQSRAERLRMVSGLFQLVEDEPRTLAGKCILLIDDIYTTGSTLEACARLLIQAGARRVVSLTLARA